MSLSAIEVTNSDVDEVNTETNIIDQSDEEEDFMDIE